MLLQSIRKTSLDSIGSWIDELSTDARRKQDEWTVNQLSSGVETASHKLRVFVCISIPQLQSRIMHAAKAILPELTRGHFVPMLTIALACLGRIRSIVMQLGQECLTCLQKNKVQIEGSTGHLFEISHDELVAKMNELVNDLRWRDAVYKFGLSKSFLHVEKGRDVNRIDSVAEKSDLESMVTGGASTNDDMGELVTGSVIAGFGDKGEVYEHEALLSKQIVEELPLSAEKNVKSEQTNNNSTSDEQPKKKKRKKKKKKSISSAADDSCVNEQQQGVAISAGSEGESDKNRGNGNTNDISLFDESADSPKQTNTPDSKQEGVRKSEKSRKKKRSKDIDAIFDDNFDNKQYDSGSINAAIEDSSKRKKKKSKKKKGSVIDDIFG